MTSFRSREETLVGTLSYMAEIPEGELADHLGDILRRVAAGEDLVVTVDGTAAVDLSPHRRAVGLEEFLSWPKADRSLLEDIKKMRGDQTTDDLRNPWERRA
jgi:antitoxin (DNA-binding transcriptional repressor) of toxin-antitoxin stability system